MLRSWRILPSKEKAALEPAQRLITSALISTCRAVNSICPVR